MNIFTQFIKSMYSTKTISTFRNQGIGKTIFYIFFLTFISSIPAFIYMSTETVNGLQSLTNIFEKEIPSFTIEDGLLKSDQTEPYINETDDFVFILDSTNTTKLKDVSFYQTSIALLMDKIVLTSNYQTQTLDYSMFNGIKVDEKDILNFIYTFESMLPIFLVILNVILFFMTSLTAFIEVLILAVFGLILKNILRLPLKFSHTFILSAYSVTIPTIFFTIMSALHIQVPYGGPLNWFVSTIILYVVLKEIPNTNSKH